MSKDYLWYQGGECMLLVNDQSKVEQEQVSHFTLGVSFLRAYYSIYDMDDQWLGLVPLRQDIQREHEL